MNDTNLFVEGNGVNCREYDGDLKLGGAITDKMALNSFKSGEKGYDDDLKAETNARQKKSRAPKRNSKCSKNTNVKSLPNVLTSTSATDLKALYCSYIAGHHDVDPAQTPPNDSFTELHIDDLVDEKHRVSNRSLSRTTSEASGSETKSTETSDIGELSVEDALIQISRILIDGIALPKVLALVDDENESVCSDITGLTEAFQSKTSAQSKRVSMTGTVVSDDTTKSAEFPDDLFGDQVLGGSPVEPPLAHNNRLSHRISAHYRVEPMASALSKGGGARATISRRVSFSEVHVRFYECILTDNPAVRDGPSIGIGWRFRPADTHIVNDWEAMRGGNVRKSSHEMIVPRKLREQRLKDVGYTQSDIANMCRKILRAKKQRAQTVNNLNIQSTEEAIERAQRKVRRFLSFGATRSMLKK